MDSRHIIAVDQSTSATKVMLFDRHARLLERVSLRHTQSYPDEGFVEHNPEEIFDNTLVGIRELMAKTKLTRDSISAIAITNQRETALLWDRVSGKPVSPAAVWQCQRGVPYCEELRSQGMEEVIRGKTGLILDSYYSASKLHWMMHHIGGLEEKALREELLMGTMDTWLLWKLTAGTVHATDYSNACRTMLFHIHNLDWDDELMRLFGLSRAMFPEVKYSDEVFGLVDKSFDDLVGIPIAGIMGDSHAALFGQQCVTPGMSKATFGTGSSVMMNTGILAPEAPRGLVTSIGFAMNRQVEYVLEGNIHSTGDTLNWMSKELELIDTPGEAESLALSVSDTAGAYLVPAFVGLGAPYWDHDARALICGMSRDTRKAHLVRAGLESIAYQIRDLTDLMAYGAPGGLQELRVDGGPTRNEFLMQFLADQLQRPVVRAGLEEISALGSVFMAGMAVGCWKDREEIAALRVTDRTFTPNTNVQPMNALYEGWKQAVQRARWKH
jgi:glycerol kinase